MHHSNPYESPLANPEPDPDPNESRQAQRGTDPFWVLAASAWTLLVTMLIPVTSIFPDWLRWSVVGVSVFLVVMAGLARPYFLLLVTIPIAAALTFVLRVVWFDGS